MARRQTFARVCGALGITAALEALPRSPGVLVLDYHRMGNPEECPYDVSVFSATAEDFDAQISQLKRTRHIATLDEVIWLAQHPESIRGVEVLITFDDGYRDNFEIAFPILRSHGVQGTFFLVTSFIGGNHLPWWDQIAFMVRNSRTEEIFLRYPHAIAIPFGGERIKSIRRILRLYKSPSTTDTARFMAELSDACGVAPPDQANGPLFLDWNEAREMVRGGMAIGSHTHSHKLLAKLDPAEQLQELSCSREILGEQLGIKIRALAFPVGSTSAFDDHTKAAAREAGYECAFSYYGGVNRPGNIDSYNLLRESVDADVSVARFRLRVATLSVLGRTI